MSLVAYDNSGESSDEDEKYKTVRVSDLQNNKLANNNSFVELSSEKVMQYADKNNSETRLKHAVFTSSDTAPTELNLPAPKATASGVVEQNTNVNRDGKENELFSDLSSVTRYRDVVLAEAELEDIVKPSQAEIELRAKVKPTKRSKIQIAIPALLPVDGDSDDDDDKVAVSKKFLKPSTHKSALLASLPPPSSMTTVTALVPQSLSKPHSAAASLAKPASATSSLANQRSTKPSVSATVSSAAALESRHDDSDEEVNINFFSLDTDTSCHMKTSCDAASLGEFGDPSSVWSSVQPLPVTAVRRPADAPLLFEPTSVHSWTPLVDSRSTADYAATPSTSTLARGDNVDTLWTADNTDTELLTDDTEVPSYTEEMVHEMNTAIEEPFEDFQNKINDPQFQRMFGKKGAKKGVEVKVISARLDDVLGGVDLTKNLSQEVDNVMSHSKKRNKDMPSGQQKRKHQITFLAFKAKERELELKNQWAENKFNKRQTQSKYGF